MDALPRSAKSPAPYRAGPDSYKPMEDRRQMFPTAICLPYRPGVLIEQSQEYARCDSGTDNAGYIGAHGVHEQEVSRVLLLAHHL